MKKINSIATILAFILCIHHFISMSLLMLGTISWSRALMISGFLIMAYLLLHGVYSIITMVKDIRRSKDKISEHPSQSGTESFVQAITGVAMLLFAIMHIVTIGSFMQNRTIPGLVAMLAFTILVCIHFTIGFPKAMVTITKKTQYYKAYQLASGAVCLILAVITIYSCIAY